MILHEFQAKELLARFGIAIPRGRVAGSAADAERMARRLGFPRFAIKAQIHGGGRSAAGGVRFASTAGEAGQIAAELIGKRLTTVQTGPRGAIVRWVYLEEAFEVARAIYAAVTVDRSMGRLILIASTHGGMDIEARAAEDPGALVSEPLKLTDAAVAGHFEGIAARIGLEGDAARSAAEVFSKLSAVAQALDATLVEVNPLALTSDGKLVALDAKLKIDDNALFRHPALAALRAAIEIEDGDPQLLAADRHQLNYQKMDGDIGLVVNGAGLALATLDMIVDAGGKAANFMDIRTTATSLDVAYGMELVLANPRTRAVLINVHGGGMQRCDTIAEGVAIAMRRSGRTLPLVTRLAGNNADFARVRLNAAGIDFIEGADMWDAVKRTVSLVQREAA